MKSKSSCFFSRFLAGLGISLIIIWIFGLVYGSNIWGIIAVSIICTSGLTLILYIPIIYFVGWMGQRVLLSNFDCQSIKKNTNNIGSITSNQKVIMKYILQVENTLNKEQIITNLYGAGWSRQEIEQVFKIID